MNLAIRVFQWCDKDAVVALWRACGLVVPWNDPYQDIQRKLAVQPELFFVGILGERVVATVMAGYDGHRGWIHYLAVHPDEQGRGLGWRMMIEAEAALQAMGCPKINLQVRETNSGVLAFYRRIGFSDDAVISLGKRLEIDDQSAAGGSGDHG